MKRHKVTITETITRSFDVSAENEQEAIDKVVARREKLAEGFDDYELGLVVAREGSTGTDWNEKYSAVQRLLVDDVAKLDLSAATQALEEVYEAYENPLGIDENQPITSARDVLLGIQLEIVSAAAVTGCNVDDAVRWVARNYYSRIVSRMEALKALGDDPARDNFYKFWVEVYKLIPSIIEDYSVQLPEIPGSETC